VVSYQAKVLELCEWVGATTPSWELQAVEAPAPVRQKDQGSQPEQEVQGQVEAGG
jgi:hypothetical protein